MKLYATSFCVLMLFGAGVICDNDSKSKGAVVDRSCDLKKVELPAHWRAECVADGKLRRDTPARTQRACERLLANERIMRKRGCF